MSDHFFGFDTAMPTLGAGKDLENEFLTADIEDEEIDALNEETFGNDVESFDWEEDHEKFAQEEQYIQNAIKRAPSQAYYIQSQIIDSGYETERKLPSHEEIMEQSISQLVLEDDLDDPAIMNIAKTKPIPTTRHHKQSLYSASSSPPGLLDTEQLVSPGRLNIWGSPTRITQCDDGLQALLQSLKSSSKPVLSFEDPSIVSASQTAPPGFSERKLSHSLPNAKTVDEIERELAVNKSSAKTLEEIERDILLKSKTRTGNEIEQELTVHASPTVSPVLNGPLIQMPIGTPPHGYSIGQPVIPQSGRISPLTVRPGERGTPPSHSFTMAVSTSSLGMHSPSPPLSVRSPSPPPLSNLPLISSNVSPFVSWMVPPFQRGPVQPMLGHVLNSQMGIRGPIGRGGRMSPPNLVPYVLAPRVPLPMSFSDHCSFQGRRGVFSSNQIRYPAYNSFNRPRLNLPYRKFSDSGDYRNHNNLHNQQNHMNQTDVNFWDQSSEIRHGDDDDEDEYAGLMTQKEKDWLVKIQLLQLQSNNPYLDDFYYTTYMMKNLTKDKSSKVEGTVLEKSEEPKLLLPQRGQSDAKTYKPVQFENSLGKLQVASVNYPRKMIDVDLLISAEEEESKSNASREFKKHRQLLLDIEKLYTVLLELDDIEKKILALPEAARKSLYQTHQSLTKQLFCGLSCQNTGSEKFSQIMGIRKGKLLVKRALAYFDKEYVHLVLLNLFKNLAYIIKKDAQSEILRQFYLPVAQAIKSSHFSAIIEYGNRLQNKKDDYSPAHQRSNILQALQNKFGMSVICCLISRAEYLYAKELWELDNEQQSQWSKIILDICDIFNLLQCSNLEKPQENFTTLLAHFQRFPIERTKFELLEERLKFLQTDYCS